MRYHEVMASAVAPEVEHLTDELIKRLGRLAHTAAARHQADREGYARNADRSVGRRAVAGRGRDETDQLDESLWGSAPTDQEIASARQVSYAALQDALSDALADALTREQAAARLGVTPQAISKRVASGALVALRRGRISQLPSWQFYEDSTLPNLKQLIDAYPGGALSLTTWATSPSADLSRGDARSDHDPARWPCTWCSRPPAHSHQPLGRKTRRPRHQLPAEFATWQRRERTPAVRIYHQRPSRAACVPERSVRCALRPPRARQPTKATGEDPQGRGVVSPRRRPPHRTRRVLPGAAA